MARDRIFRALGDATRLQIVELLSGGELCACRILERFAITQPTLSHHMRILCECGLVVARKAGKWTYYSLSAESLSDLRRWAESLGRASGNDD